jgi:hypothetical protein
MQRLSFLGFNKKAIRRDGLLHAFRSGKNYLPFLSSETLNFFLPRARRRAMTALPLAVDIRCLNPCLLVRLRLLGWYVLFMNALFFGSAKLDKNCFLAAFQD